MTLVLSRSDTAKFRAASEALLSPLDHETLDKWALASLQRIRELVGSDRTLLLLPLDGHPSAWTDDLRPEALSRMADYVEGFDQGRMRLRDKDVDRAYQRRFAAGIRVWSHRTMERFGGERLLRSAYYRDVLKSEGLTHCYGIRKPMPLGDAQINAGFSRPSKDRFGERHGPEVLGMLLPAFSAAVEVLLKVRHVRCEIVSLIDALGLPLALFGQDGAERHRTSQLRALLAGEHDAPRLVGEMHSLARDTSALRERLGKTSDGSTKTSGTRTLALGARRYRLRVVFLPVSVTAPDASMLVLVEPPGPALPSVGELVAHCRLTRREAEVALLLAVGATDVEVGRQLALSPHTVRKHTEHIFDKLQLHSRKALALRLMAATSSEPAVVRPATSNSLSSPRPFPDLRTARPAAHTP